MTPTTRPTPPSTVSTTLNADRLSVPGVMYFVLAAATPFTVIAGVVTTGYAVTGKIGLPIAFLAIGAALALFSVGYVTMAKTLANAGAFYAYVAQGLGRPVGVAASWVALIAYNGLQVGLYGAVGAAVTPLLEDWFGLQLPWWVIALAAWLIIALLGLQRVDLNSTVLAVLLLAEVAIILIYSLASLANPAGDSVAVDGLNPTNLTGPGVGALLALGVLGFIGFESTVVYSEEARDPHRTIRIATYTTVGLLAGLYALASWAMSVATGPDHIVAQSQQHSTELIFTLARTHLGETLVHIGHALFATSVLAAMIAFHNTSARYAFALGRERVLPAALGRTSPRTGSPRLGSVIQSLIGLAVITTYAASSWDPVVHLFFWAGGTGGLGILLLITTTAIAVLVYFRRHPTNTTPWRHLIAPTLAALALAITLTLAIANVDILLGVEPTSPLRWGIPLAYALIALLGTAWGLILRRTRPDIYAAIGRGAKSATTRTTPTPLTNRGARP